MATLGKTATPNSSTHGWIESGGKQVAMLFTMPETGLIQSVSFWAAGVGTGHVTIHGAVWTSSGGTLAFGAGVDTSGGQGANPGGSGQWYTSTVGGQIVVTKNTQIFIGWQPETTGTVSWAYNGNDHSPDAQQHAASGSAQQSFAGWAAESPAGAVAAYMTYQPVAIHIYDGTAWQSGLGTYEYDGSVWQPSSGILIYDGSAWQYAI